MKENVYSYLKSRLPIEILELLDLDTDPELLVELLSDHIQDNFELVENNMRQNGLLDEDEEEYEAI